MASGLSQDLPEALGGPAVACGGENRERGKGGGDFLITFPQDFFKGTLIGFALLFMLKRERACLMKKIMTIAAGALI